MPKNEADLKWTCRKCTYKNWPTASSCVMCKYSPKTSRRSSPELSGSIGMVIGNEVSEEIISINDKNGACGSMDKAPLKWTCPLCSYLNWMRSENCVMCRSGKPNEFKLVESLRNIENNGEAKNNELKKDKSKFISAGNINGKVKWLCLKCTYENWQKSVKCALCQHPRNKSYKDDNGKINDKVERNVKFKKTTSPRRTPPRSPNSVSRNSSNIFEIPKQEDDKIIDLAAAMERLHAGSDNQRINQIRNRLSTKDWVWLAACKGVADHDLNAVSTYLATGGDRTRHLTPDDVLVLNEPGRFEPGHTLVHLAIKYQREDILRMVLIPEAPLRTIRKLPCHTCPELSTTIRKQWSHSIRTRKGEFPCPFFTEIVTFSLPGEILEFDPQIQHQVFSDILDIDVRKVLEEESLINWNEELVNQYGSCLYPLWNRAAGDCLLDSVLQSTWGVFDRDNTLRKKLYEALAEGHRRFFPRWQEAEQLQASEMNYALEEEQWKNDWGNIVSLAANAGNSLEQAHVFALAHILRRPIIIYAVKYVKSLCGGETIDLARFEGVYLPLLWNEDFCWKNPIALGYTRGHFSALVPMERPSCSGYTAGAGANAQWNEDDAHVTYLPLIDHEGHLLPVHFLTQEEVGHEEQLLQKHLDCCITDGGILAAKQTVSVRPALVNQMIDEWMNRYRKQQIELLESKGAYKQ